jgi:hypothetical protein
MSWKQEINNFIDKRINYEERSLILDTTDLRHNMLIQAHQDKQVVLSPTL